MNQEDGKFLIELKAYESMKTVFISRFSLEYDYDICLWEDVDELIGWGKRNIYRIINSFELLAGKLYWFHWVRDAACIVPGYSL